MNKRPPLHPLSLRVTFEEMAKLEKAAAGMSLSDCANGPVGEYQ
jgi:hypothetical protein